MKRSRTIKEFTMNICAGPERIFPLLCPVREYEWIQPWKCEVVYTNSGIAELDCVFKTQFPEDGPEDTWVVSRYEPPKRIEFIRVNSLRSIRYSIEIISQQRGSSRAIWKQVITGLNKEGDDFVNSITDVTYNEEMALLEKMINHFLKTGDLMKLT
ncbi:MAG TPA: hypothetical protein PKY78_09075 [Candidatus Omnitrophota bacterium]|nr:hypothetical protein [Candidatus Omnitrophota bacterium]HPS21120.1 hypothetical protein [Candidatus Omnitrophota bacterium]